jgi:hypothetical protein
LTGGGAEEQFEDGVGGVQVEKRKDLFVDFAGAALVDQAEAVEFGELGLDQRLVQTEAFRRLAGGEGVLGFEQAQAIHADGRKGRAAGNSWAGGAEGEKGGCARGGGDGPDWARGLCLGGGVIEVRKEGPRAVDGVRDHFEEDLGLFGEFGIHGGFLPRSHEAGWVDVLRPSGGGTLGGRSGKSVASRRPLSYNLPSAPSGFFNPATDYQ